MPGYIVFQNRSVRIQQHLLNEIETLTPEMRRQVAEFIALLRVRQNCQIRKLRTVGEYVGQITISDDLNAHFGDDFWLSK